MNTLFEIQQRLNAPKNLYNSFGKYKYRSCEGILEAVKPLLKELQATLLITDEMVEVGGRVYVKADVRLMENDGSTTHSTAYAREADSKSGMDAAQVTGAASSYARKYALNALFLIDDTKDPDTDEYTAASKGQSKPAFDMAALKLLKPTEAAQTVANLVSRASLPQLIELSSTIQKADPDLWDMVKIAFTKRKEQLQNG